MGTLTTEELMAMNMNNRQDDGMWGNPFVYLVWIWAFNAFGGGGFGGFNNAAANGALTRAELYDGFTMNNIERQIQGLQTGLCDGFYSMNTTNLQGFNGISRDLCTGFNGINQNINQARFDNQQCCCETNRNIDALRFQSEKNTCDIVNAIHQEGETTRALINQNTMQELRDQLQAAQLQLGNVAQTQTLINELRPCAKPAYITCSPYTTSFNSCGSACGC